MEGILAFHVKGHLIFDLLHDDSRKYVTQGANDHTDMKRYIDAKLRRGMSADDDSDGVRTDVEENNNEKVKKRRLNGGLLDI